MIRGAFSLNSLLVIQETLLIIGRMSLSKTVTADLTHNLKIYGWIRMLSARVYLPLITIYVAEVGRLTLGQIGLLTTIAAAVSLLANIPTGYYADRRTRRAALTIGSLFIIGSTLLYVVFPSFPGAIIATICDSLGYSFLSGAGEALIHDTLVSLGKERDYVRVMGRAQSFGMSGNVVLVGIVPLTYGLDKRLPFLCGAVAVIIFLLMVNSLVEPPRPAQPAVSQAGNHVRRLIRALHQFVNRRTLLLFVAIGFMNAAYTSYVPFAQLTFKDIGLQPNVMGIMYAAASLLAAAGGLYIHYLCRLPFLVYTLLDAIIGSGYLIVLGLTHNLWLAILGFLVNMSFWRLRSILYQDQLLRQFGHHHHKATLISTISFFAGLQQLWLPLVFSGVVAAAGYHQGLTIIGSALMITASSLFGLAIMVWKWSRPAATAPQSVSTVSLPAAQKSA